MEFLGLGIASLRYGVSGQGPTGMSVCELEHASGSVSLQGVLAVRPPRARAAVQGVVF